MSWNQFKHQYLVRFWSPFPAVIAAGVLSAYYFGLTGTFWCRHRRVHPLGRARSAVCRRRYF